MLSGSIKLTMELNQLPASESNSQLLNHSPPSPFYWCSFSHSIALASSTDQAEQCQIDFSFTVSFLSMLLSQGAGQEHLDRSIQEANDYNNTISINVWIQVKVQRLSDLPEVISCAYKKFRSPDFRLTTF